MAQRPPSQNPLDKALVRRKELSDQIRKSLQEIEEIEKFIQAFRKYSTDPSKGEVEEGAARSVGRAAHGESQKLFEHIATEVLRKRGEPLQSPDFLEEFERRGFPLGGTNATKQMWNRLWQAKDNGVLVHFPKPGYWLAGEPIPSLASMRAQTEAEGGNPKPKRAPHARPYTGRARGRVPLLTEAQIQQAREWLAEGKTVREVAKLLNVATGTIYSKIRGGRKGFENTPDQLDDQTKQLFDEPGD